MFEVVPSNCTNGMLRLAGKVSPTGDSGRLEVCHNGAWGTVCYGSVGEREARVACGQLGFQSIHGKLFLLCFIC